MKNDFEILEVAVGRNWRALEYASLNLRDSETLILKAV
jgi:hypothetical protein